MLLTRSGNVSSFLSRGLVSFVRRPAQCQPTTVDFDRRYNRQLQRFLWLPLGVGEDLADFGLLSVVFRFQPGRVVRVVEKMYE